jgi:hypothetical protein
MIQVQAKTRINYAAVGEAISHELAAKMVKDHCDQNPEAPISFFIGREIIEQVLGQPGCVAIRIFNAIDESGRPTLVYAGVDKNGHTIIEYPVVTEEGALVRVKATIGDRAGGGGGDSTPSLWWSI